MYEKSIGFLFFRCIGKNEITCRKTNLRTYPMLESLQNSSAISKKEFDWKKPSNSARCRFYGLPRVHKACTPLRPLVAEITTLTHANSWAARLFKEAWLTYKHSIKKCVKLLRTYSVLQRLIDLQSIVRKLRL